MIRALQGRYNERRKPWGLLAEEFTRSEPKHPPLEYGPPLSSKTVKSYMNDAGYHKCRACQKSWISAEQAQNRLYWCERHQWPRWKWMLVHWSDECHFH